MRLKGMENTLSRNERESQHLKSWFTKFDTNNSYTLDEGEFGSALRQMGFKLSLDEVRTLMERFDREGDGEIDYREFAGWVSAEYNSSRGLGIGFKNIETLIRKVHKIASIEPNADVSAHRSASPPLTADAHGASDIGDDEDGEDGDNYWPMGGDMAWF